MCEFGIVKSPLEDFMKGRNVTIALVIWYIIYQNEIWREWTQRELIMI